MSLELTHTQAVHRLKDIADEIDRLEKKDSLTDEDRTYWDELVAESGEVADHADKLVRKAEAERVRIRAAAQPRPGAQTLPVERGSDGGELDRDILDPDSV